MGKEVDDFFGVYIKANMRFPQMDAGLRVMMLTHFLGDQSDVSTLFKELDFQVMANASAELAEGAHRKLFKKNFANHDFENQKSSNKHVRHFLRKIRRSKVDDNSRYARLITGALLGGLKQTRKTLIRSGKNPIKRFFPPNSVTLQFRREVKTWFEHRVLNVKAPGKAQATIHYAAYLDQLKNSLPIKTQKSLSNINTVVSEYINSDHASEIGKKHKEFLSFNMRAGPIASIFRNDLLSKFQKTSEKKLIEGISEALTDKLSMTKKRAQEVAKSYVIY